MNRSQIAKIYDNFPDGKKNMPREQFIREVTAALDPNQMRSDLNRMVQGKRQKTMIDNALKQQRG